MKPLASLAAWTAAFAFATTCASAQTIVNGPYYATPSWDQTLPVAGRFLVLSNFNNDAVLDRETGLVWQRTPSTAPLAWLPAYDGCLRESTGGRKAWRLPSAPEVMSLFDPVPASMSPLPVGHPFNFPAAGTQLWTSTSVDTGLHYQVQFFIGTVPLQPVRYGDALGGYVLCVRGPVS